MHLLADPLEPNSWTCVNDDVMGGRSDSRVIRSGEGTLQFSGTVSLANNGGFASTKAQCNVDLSAATGLVLRAHGPPRRYRLTVRTNSAGRISYRVPFWTTPQSAMHYLPFVRLQPMRRGQPRPDAPPFDAAAIREVGFLIGDEQEGDFALHVDCIQPYTART